jgi:Rps23 Pro-64 3,4-dihydroxylase Tpa1-like proline 4-hydroxylase
MQNLKIALIQEPFPHAIIDDFYDEKELALIWQELDFYTSPGKFDDAILTGGAKDQFTQEPLPKHSGLQLDDLYGNKRNISNILTCNRKVFKKEILEAFASLSPLIWDAKMVNYDTTIVKYYEDGEYYKPHRDNPRFTCLTYLYKEPKAFTGGDLHFHQFDYTIPIVNNRLIFFTGCIEHASVDIVMNKEYNNSKMSGFGKYTITQFLGMVNG